jgi:hypothetical protein
LPGFSALSRLSRSRIFWCMCRQTIRTQTNNPDTGEHISVIQTQGGGYANAGGGGVDRAIQVQRKRERERGEGERGDSVSGSAKADRHHIRPMWHTDV